MAASAEKLLNLLLRHGSLSRADLAKAMHLSRPAVSGLVDGLIRQGVLRETGCGASNGGKPPIMLEPVAERFGTIGVDIGHETLLRGVLCDASGKQLAVMELPHGNTFESISEQALKLAASQANQNSYLTATLDAQTSDLIRRINPMPVPAYQVPAPYPYCGTYNNGCGCGC